LSSIVKAAQYLIILTLVALLFVYVTRFPNHFSDASWPARIRLEEIQRPPRAASYRIAMSAHAVGMVDPRGCMPIT